jgi:hypothetical protein
MDSVSLPQIPNKLVPGTRTKDLTGLDFGWWSVVRFVRTEPVGKRNVIAIWLCRCRCGIEREVRGHDLKQGKTQSCGCSFGRDQDHAGERFGRLVVVSKSEERTTARKHSTHWLCRCDCGNDAIVAGRYLRNGDTTSCGCAKREVHEAIGDLNRTHGKCGTPEYQAWCAIKTRCENQNQVSWDDYGGRGIRMCQRWAESFEAFLEDMGPKPDGDYSLDRLDVDGGYCPENCKWSSRKEQNNNKRNNRTLTYNGETLTVAQWAERLSVSAKTLTCRIGRGWDAERALTAPIKPRPPAGVGTLKGLWQNMIYRCHHENCPDYPKYGGRGIEVCDRWRDSFQAFLEDVGPRPSPNHSLDRIDNNSNYDPGNVRWATSEQQANNRRNSRLLTCDGITQGLSQWARQLGVSAPAILARLKGGMSEQEALSKPFMKRRL